MNTFVRRIRNIGNSGSTLIAVMVVTTILSLFLITLQPIMLNYAQRSIDERDLKQAEFSARSANDAIVEAIEIGNATLIAGINGIASNGSSLVLDNFTFSSSQMGNVEARIERISTEEFSVITRATVNGAQRTIGREIIKESTGGGSDPNALPAYYFHNVTYTTGRGFVTTGDTPVVVANVFNVNGGILNIEGDLVLYNSNLNNTRIRGVSRLYLDGNLYTGSGRFRIQNTAEAYIKGNLYRRTTSSTNLDLRNSDCPDLYDVTQSMRDIYDVVPSWVSSNGTNYTTGMTLDGGSYYVIGSNTTIADINSQLSANVTPENPVYLIVRSGRDLILSNPLDPPVSGVAKAPRVVFILENSADLILQHQSSAVVYGTNSNSRLYVNNPGLAVSTLYGQVRVGTLYHIRNNNMGTLINYQIILDYQVASTQGTVTWTSGQYKKATY